MPLLIALAVASAASRKLIIPSVALANSFAIPPKLMPVEAPSWFRLFIITSVCIASRSALNAAVTANIFAAQVA